MARAGAMGASDIARGGRMPTVANQLVHSPLRARAIAITLFGVLASCGVAASQVLIAPGGGVRFVSSQSKANAFVDLQSASGPALGDSFEHPTSVAFDPATGAFASASTSLQCLMDSSQFIVESGAVSSASAPNGSQASTEGGAVVYTLFVVDRCQEYVVGTTLTFGTLPTGNVQAYFANLSGPGVQFVNMIQAAGTTSFRGRISPGTYLYFYKNHYDETTETGTAHSLFAGVGFTAVPDPLIAQHPQDVTVTAGSQATFSVGTGTMSRAAQSARESGALTYQWRRDFQPVLDGGRFSGATTTQLTIASASIADTGMYDCVVSEGTIDEPSSVARLHVTGGTTDVGPTIAASELALAAPAPSPFTTRTNLRYTLPRPAVIQLDVFDVAGRCVRSIARNEHRAAGEYLAAWDGLDDRGTPVGSGVYFVHLHAGMQTTSRRVVRSAR